MTCCWPVAIPCPLGLQGLGKDRAGELLSATGTMSRRSAPFAPTQMQPQARTSRTWLTSPRELYATPQETLDNRTEILR